MRRRKLSILILDYKRVENVVLEMYGEKYGELKHILKRAHGFYLTRIQTFSYFQLKEK